MAMDDGYFEEESNMRLSRAFVVVLILHVVAVGGILLFNNMKAGQHAANSTALETFERESQPADAQAGGALRQAANSAPAAETSGPLEHVLGAGDTLSKLSRQYNVSVDDIIAANELRSTRMLRVGQKLAIPVKEAAPVPEVGAGSAPAKPASGSDARRAQPADAAPAPGGTYTVVKGDNPHAIARRFGVDYRELLEINGIEDPRLLQIGQELVLPAKR